MARVVVLLLFVAALALLPVWTFDASVMPELLNLKSAYGSAEATAQQIAGE